jgi:hypothetical protein
MHDAHSAVAEEGITKCAKSTLTEKGGDTEAHEVDAKGACCWRKRQFHASKSVAVEVMRTKQLNSTVSEARGSIFY